MSDHVVETEVLESLRSEPWITNRDERKTWPAPTKVELTKESKCRMDMALV